MATTLTIKPHSIHPDENSQAPRVLRRAFDRYLHHIHQIKIRCTDRNGPRGGVDKECRIEMKLLHGGTKVVSAVGSTALEAGCKAVDKAKEILRRLSERRRIHARSRNASVRHANLRKGEMLTDGS